MDIKHIKHISHGVLNELELKHLAKIAWKSGGM